jgi:hypothetical protein
MEWGLAKDVDATWISAEVQRGSQQDISARVAHHLVQ